MIEKERLEELIVQRATVYMARAYTEGIYLMPENFEVNDKELVFKYKLYVVPLEDLFETEEEAKWYREFGRIERTERLVLPTFEDFERSFKLVRFIDKEGNRCKIEGYYNDKTNSGFIDVVVNGESQIMLSDYTKENYTLACRKAKELFLGEKK